MPHCKEPSQWWRSPKKADAEHQPFSRPPTASCPTGMPSLPVLVEASIHLLLLTLLTVCTSFTQHGVSAWPSHLSGHSVFLFLLMQFDYLQVSEKTIADGSGEGHTSCPASSLPLAWGFFRPQCPRGANLWARIKNNLHPSSMYLVHPTDHLFIQGNSSHSAELELNLTSQCQIIN